MKICVDEDKCQGHNRCMTVAPGLFELDDYGYASPVNNGIVAPDDEGKARLAVANCPEFAIEFVE